MTGRKDKEQKARRRKIDEGGDGDEDKEGKIYLQICVDNYEIFFKNLVFKEVFINYFGTF